MDSTQAAALISSLQGQSVGGWHVDGAFGHGKSAVVVKASRGGVQAALKVFHPELVERFGRAALVGAWLGAHLGITAIPEEWRKHLVNHKAIENATEALSYAAFYQ